jgi:hypothetical protein
MKQLSIVNCQLSIDKLMTSTVTSGGALQIKSASLYCQSKDLT